MNEDIVMLPCIRCRSSEVGTELRCMGSYVQTVCYSCGWNGPTSEHRDRAKSKWNTEDREKGDG